MIDITSSLDRLARGSGAFVTLCRALKIGGSSASLVSGADGEGLFRLVMLSIRKIICPTECGQCPNCKKLAINSHPNINLTLKSDKILVDDVRQIIQQSALKPFFEGDKYMIISDASLLNASSQNKLLKTLEEPPQNTHFILITTRPDALLPTVRSRLNKIVLAPFSFEDICKELARVRNAAAESETGEGVSVRLAALYANGSLSAARDNLDEGRLNILEAVENLPKKLESSRNVLECAAGLVKAADLPFLLTSLEIRFLRILEGGEEYGYNPHSAAHIIFAIAEARSRLSLNCNAAAVIESLLFKILEVRMLCRQ